MKGSLKTMGIIAGFILGIMVVPAYAVGGSMGPARMTLHTEVPFMSQGVIEVPIRVINTANESERIMLFTTEDLNNSEIMDVNFAEEQLVLMPKEERVVDVTFEVKKPGTFSGNIVSVFNSVNEQSSSAIGSTVGLRLNSKVSIVAESKVPSYISIDSAIALGVAAIIIELLLIGRVLYKGKRRKKKEEEKG
jgi:hypothetical protein